MSKRIHSLFGVTFDYRGLHVSVVTSILVSSRSTSQVQVQEGFGSVPFVRSDFRCSRSWYWRTRRLRLSSVLLPQKYARKSFVKVPHPSFRPVWVRP